MGSRAIFVVTQLFYHWIVVMVVKLFKFTENHWAVYFKWVNFMVCKLYPNKAVKIFFKIKKSDDVFTAASQHPAQFWPHSRYLTNVYSIHEWISEWSNNQGVCTRMIAWPTERPMHFKRFIIFQGEKNN